MLGVSPAGYHAWRRRPVSARQLSDQDLLEAIQPIVRHSHGRYGSPRVHQQLRAQGIHVARKRVARLMRVHGMRAQRPPRRLRTTDSRHGEPVAENLLGRNFSATVGNQKWVSDITYISTRQGWLYLAVVIDLYSRRVVGWSMDKRQTKSLVIRALMMAVNMRKPSVGLIHHSDRGSQYASLKYQASLKQHGIVCSMSRKGNCWDNAVVERFFSSLKREWIRDNLYRTREEAIRDVRAYIVTWYNSRRPHSTLGYKSPIEFEKCA